MIRKLIIGWTAILAISACKENPSTTIESNFNLGIIPAPNNVQDQGLVSDIKEIKIFLNDEMKSSYIVNLFQSIKNVSWVEENQANVKFISFPELEKEGYSLHIQKDKIEISASSPTGLQFALVSLAHIIQFKGFPLPQVVIEDSPKFAYRGMHLDVARHFFGVGDVKKFLDYMAYYKFNNFHWHLTEDQGWRIEIKKYPKLHEVGAYRKETLIGHYNDEPQKYDGTRYGGFYTQEEIKEIVVYAGSRNINVIPEIEMPGHALAALAAYPELGCENKKYETATKWGVFEDVFCPNEATFKFLENVIDEVITLFPGQYIHIGGDECPKEAWKRSAFCQALIKKENLKNEHGLQSYFIQRMEKYINSKGKKIIGWDEILEGGLAPNATVMSWRGIEGGIAAARQKHDVIMTSGTHCYFDHYQSESPEEPLAIGGLTTVEKVYGWEVIPDSLEVDKRKYILGGQANLWSEYIEHYSGVEYMAYARGMAMTEALWTNNRNYANFLQRYDLHNDYWKSHGANVAYHVYDLKPKIKAGTGELISVAFELPEGSDVEYQVNGKETKAKPGESIKIETSANYIFTAGKSQRKGIPLHLDFQLHKATIAKIMLENQPSPAYPGNGPGSIINGILGSDDKYGGTEWLGFEGTDCTGVLDFGKEETMESITFKFFKGEGQWIYLPKKIEIFTSQDGKTYTSVYIKNNIVSENKICLLRIPFSDIKFRYLKFDIDNFGKMPAGAQGAGHPSWLFVDEVVVR